MKKAIAGLLIVSLVMVSLVGCSVGSDQTATTDNKQTTTTKQAEATTEPTQTTHEKVLRWGTSAAPSGVFNPLYITDNYNALVTGVVYETLLEILPNYELGPRLAKSWDVSDDQLELTFHLREGVTWSDGEPFDADDVKYTLEVIAHPDFTGTMSSYVSYIKGYDAYHNGETDTLEGVEIVDSHTIKITAGEVYAPFLENMGFAITIIPEHYWRSVPVKDMVNQTDKVRNPIGTGPYMLEEFVPDQYATVVKNENYWAGTPNIDKVVFQSVNIDTVPAMMIQGELDYFFFTSMDPDDVKLYEDNGLSFVEISSLFHQILAFNTQNEILSDKRVRQALNYAINKVGILQSLAFNYGTVGNQCYPRTHWAYPGDEFLNEYAYNPEKAIEILTQEVGWEYKAGVMYSDGAPVEFTLIYPSGNKARELSAPVIQENFKQVGVALDIQMMEFKTMLEKGLDPEPDAFDMCLIAIGVPTNANPMRSLHTNAILKDLNYARYSSPEMDALIEAGVGTLDMAKRKEIYKDLAILVNEDVPNVYLYNLHFGVVMTSKMTNWVMHPLEYNYHINEWNME